jgi:hypothetical protein
MNITYSLKEKEQNCEKVVTYNELSDLVNCLEYKEYEEEDINNLIAQEINYQTNFTKPQLEIICGYYGISKRKKRKNHLIEDIVNFETNQENIEIVWKRKKLWSYMREIKQDRYLSKFLIFN